MCYFHCASREFLFSRCVWSLVNGEVLAPCDHVRKTEETQLSTGPGPGTNTTTLASLSLGHGSQHGARYDTITKHNYITNNDSAVHPADRVLQFDGHRFKRPPVVFSVFSPLFCGSPRCSVLNLSWFDWTRWIIKQSSAIIINDSLIHFIHK